MWQLYAIVAQDLIRDRRAEARAEALHRAIHDAEGLAALRAPRPGLVRRSSAGMIRRIGAAATWVAGRASATAARLEGEPA
jgi:hypothetical protein